MDGGLASDVGGVTGVDVLGDKEAQKTHGTGKWGDPPGGACATVPVPAWGAVPGQPSAE